MEHILLKISIMLVPALLAVTLHEVAHGFIADKFGDPTARLLGRLTLNPIKHLDPIGTIALLVFGFGWARPVPVNPNNLRRAQKDMIWVSLAGPTANLLLALFSALLLRVIVYTAAMLPEGSQILPLINPIGLMAAFGLYISTILCLFNLSSEDVEIRLPADSSIPARGRWSDLLCGDVVEGPAVPMDPYRVLWLKPMA